MDLKEYWVPERKLIFIEPWYKCKFSYLRETGQPGPLGHTISFFQPHSSLRQGWQSFLEGLEDFLFKKEIGGIRFLPSLGGGGGRPQLDRLLAG